MRILWIQLKKLPNDYEGSLEHNISAPKLKQLRIRPLTRFTSSLKWVRACASQSSYLNYPTYDLLAYSVLLSVINSNRHSFLATWFSTEQFSFSASLWAQQFTPNISKHMFEYYDSEQRERLARGLARVG